MVLAESASSQRSNSASTSASASSESKSNGKKRVVAKKATVRAPIAAASSSKKEGKDDDSSDEEEMEGISLSSSESLAVSEESEEGDEKAVVTTPKSKASKAKAVKKPAAKTTKKNIGRPKKAKAAVAVFQSEEESAASSETKAKKKTGRPKSKKPIKSIEVVFPSSPIKKNQGGRPPRSVKHFVGGQKHAQLAKKIFTDPRVAVDQRPHAIVIERAIFEPEKSRRVRVPWTLQEIDNLQDGVIKHGEGFWADILSDPELYFYGSRTQIDLKDKWRNLTSYVKYQEHPLRRFVLVDSTHQMIRSDAGNLHVFSNRWPRDAALKVATKDEFYPLDENNERVTSAIIHIKELLDQEGKRERPDIVHVYRVTRVLERPKNVKKFEGYAAVWTGKVEKVAEEILVRKEEILTPEDEKLIDIQRKQEESAMNL